MKGKERRDRCLLLRVTAGERKAYQEAAWRERLSLSEWVRRRLLENAALVHERGASLLGDCGQEGSKVVLGAELEAGPLPEKSGLRPAAARLCNPRKGKAKGGAKGGEGGGS